MAGLLGDGWDDPKSAAIMALSGGLLGGNFAGGLMGAQQAYSGAQDGLLKRKLLDAQLRNYDSEIETRKLAGIKDARAQKAWEDFMTGGGNPAGNGAQPGQLGSGTAGIMPTQPGQSFAPPPQSSGGRLAGMSIEQILALQGATGKDLLPAYKFAKEGIERKPGTFYEDLRGNQKYQVDPAKGLTYENGVIGRAPGSESIAELAGQTTDAQEQAKNRNALLPLGYVDEGTGRPIGGTVGNYLQNQPVRNQGGAPLTPEMQEFIRADAQRNGITSPNVNFTGARPGQSYGVQTAQPAAAAPSIMRPQGGGLQSAAGAAAAQAEATAPITIRTNAAEKVNDSWIKTSYEPSVKAGNAASDLIGTVQTARQAMRNMGGTGWGTEAKAQGASILASLGMNPGNAKMYAANAEVFQSAAMSNLQTTLNAATGPQTEGDADRAGKTFARLKNTPQANEYILDFAEAKAQRDQMKARFFQEALPIAKGKGDLQEVEREWNKRTPSIFSMPTMKRWAGGVK